MVWILAPVAAPLGPTANEFRRGCAGAGARSAPEGTRQRRTDFLMPPTHTCTSKQEPGEEMAFYDSKNSEMASFCN